jgi:Na+/H+ antiporter NhaC
VGGGKPIGLVVGLAVAAALVLLPALIVPLFYLFANVYALIVGSDFSSETTKVAVFLIGLVMAVTLLLLLLSGAVALIGRGLSPKNRDA